MSRLNALALSLIVCLITGVGVASAQDSAPRGQAPKANAAPATPVNINTATPAELQKLPGIGAATAARIVEYRQKNGPFKKAEELMNIRGIGEKSFLKLKPLVVVTAPKADSSDR